MNSTIRGIIPFVIFLALFISGGCGETSLGGGTTVSVGDKSSAQGFFATNGVDSNAAMTSDAFKEFVDTKWVENARGDYVEHGISLYNGYNVDYNQYGSGPGQVGGTDYVFREENMNLDYADHVSAYCFATNAEGNEAKASIDITGGSLKGYFNSAFAGPFSPWKVVDGAFAAQSLTYAGGSKVTFDAYGKDSDQNIGGVKTAVTSGSLNNYGSLSAGHKQSDGHNEAGTLVYGGSATALDGKINQHLYASNNLHEAGAVTSINQGSLINSPNSLWAYSIVDLSEMRAFQTVDATSTGGIGNYIQRLSKLDGSQDDFSYSSSRVKFWDQAIISPTFVGQKHGYW